MTEDVLDRMRAVVSGIRRTQPLAYISAVAGNRVQISGAHGIARPGDPFRLIGLGGVGEIVSIDATAVHGLLDGSADGVALGTPVIVEEPSVFAPHQDWIGRIIDPEGRPLDGDPILPGLAAKPLNQAPPAAASRRALGPRLSTGLAVFDTLLPIVRGQRIGLFAGSGVGKSTLLATLAKQVEADVIVISLVGERGREVREFVEKSLGPDGMARSIVVAATSDRPAHIRRRCPLAATAIAEFFRDQGLQVLLLVDSVTRFAEAHREVAASAGEVANLRGHPASTAGAIAGLCERAGPGVDGEGDITAIYSVLVAGSDMDEPVADMLRGVLDGHVVLDRRIAERGRFPAIDVTRSVSRSLPDAATDAENRLIQQARSRLGTYTQSELMIQSGLYVTGSDPKIDDAIGSYDALDTFIASRSSGGIVGAFHLLQRILNPIGESLM